MKPVAIIGMGLSARDLTEEHLEKIEQADILVGGKRHLNEFEDFTGIKKVITKDLSEIADYIKSRMKDHSIVVLASGDPLYYGIGSFLTASLGAENVEVYPNITSVACAFARIKEPWHDAHVISLHGRDHEALLQNALATEDKLVVFTDPVRNPAWVAGIVCKKGKHLFDMCVLEQLGYAGEKVSWYRPEEAVDKTFQEPNLVILKRIRPDSALGERRLFLGAPDEWYDHECGLITKAEVRAVTLSKLRLLPHQTLWDLGAGSGSIAIEASLFIREGNIFAVEKNRERLRQIEENKKRFGVRNVTTVYAVIPDGLEGLPDPDRVFIGGGGKDLGKIIEKVSERLGSNGIVVINTVLLESCELGRKTLGRLGYKTDMVQVQINRTREMPRGERLEAQNPVWIVSGQKVFS
ncbi:MAG: precorrin-6y C5,15-methyltransferase (decarboxylating) subunit CbiE [Deltaproteobacteria bacterium]|nr:precorrin-6y C5,15-methyltransferase (decarboxylating) subunit CbiE [Deltaproteobacteria bacterium]MBW1995749.1 precorrin-6y C5,15-methyltransferase (decarboxylating) subunit CbiE [Deltaproteobacteria bacterium]